MTALAADRLTVDLGTRRALEDVTLTLSPGDMIGLVGPNGAGKTTLLRALCDLLSPAGGRVTLGGRPLADIDARERARAIGYLPQQGVIHWALPVAEVVAMGRLPWRMRWRGLSSEDRAHAARAMAALEIADLALRPATHLSGGEKARVLLARVLAGEPRYLLADEPTAGLDPYYRLETLALLADLARAGAAVLVVLHDLTLAARFCRRLLLLDRGRVHAFGTPQEVLSPERLAAVYRVEALRGRHDGADFIVPWRRL